MALKYDYTFMITEINKFLSFSNMGELIDRKNEIDMVSDLINNYIDNMNKLEEKDIAVFDRDQKLHLMICTFKVQLMSNFNDIMGEFKECFICSK